MSNLPKCHLRNGVVKHVHQRPVDIGIVLVLGASDQIEVTQDNHREGQAKHFSLQIL
jgi:hypothetical protein